MAHCRMALRQMRTVGAVELFAQGPGAVLILVYTAPLQLRHDQLDEIGERLGHHHVGEIEAVDVGIFHPLLEPIGDLFGRADQLG